VSRAHTEYSRCIPSIGLDDCNCPARELGQSRRVSTLELTFFLRKGNAQRAEEEPVVSYRFSVLSLSRKRNSVFASEANGRLYSSLRAFMGSTRVARYAGMTLANKPTPASRTETAPKVMGSVGFTP
jgi:hypothetical protein